MTDTNDSTDTDGSTDSSDPTGTTAGLAPLGSLAEAEVPQHTLDPDAAPASGQVPVEETDAYQLAAEDGATLPADGDQDPGAGELAPEFRAPGEG